MQANSKTGRALYTGHARLWQGDSVMEANSIELLREARVMNAIGNVRAVFPQAAGQSTAQTLAVQAGPKKPKLWHVTAGNPDAPPAAAPPRPGKKKGGATGGAQT